MADNKKLNVACIGIGVRGVGLLKNNLLSNSDVNIVALCDVNTGSRDYPEFISDRHGGLDAGIAIVKEKNGRLCKGYQDYRQMLEAEDIDAVVIATPDHSHAVITMAAINKGIGVYCEKPLTHNIAEARKVTEAARAAGVVTQMGNHGHSSEDIRLVCEWISDGAIGDVTEVQAWTNRPADFWPQGGLTRPEEKMEVPANLDWDLWIGPAAYRDYHGCYEPHDWRGWWEFGTGSLGDMGCHILDPVFWALDIGSPISVEASSTEVTSESPPLASMIIYEFPSRRSKPAVKLTWYDGGLMPASPDDLEDGRRMGDSNGGVIFVGSKGKIMCGCYGSNPRLIPETKMRKYTKPAKSIARSVGHMQEWVDACLGKGEKPGSNFDYAGPLTEIVLLANVALRAGEKIEWDGPNMRVTNVAEANAYVRRLYRGGWSL
ncbi:MAG: Gfo/Idh/MocA family oxidoreductase [Planctomycetes bacterium]|nr:Gfo/Idh/MocA family oxidoreductase [Planctomycetota bacterium]